VARDPNASTDWVREAKDSYRHLFSELDVLLRALDRFLLDTASGEDAVGKNFKRELSIVRDVSLRVLGILETVIPEDKKNAYWFRKYAESKLLTEKERKALRDEFYRQDTQEKSLYLLYDSFINLKGVINDLLRNQVITHSGFLNLSDIICKEIRDNLYFNPFNEAINPEFDLIENKSISDIVKGLKEKDIKKTASVVFLELFRLLRYLRHIDISSSRSIPIHCSLLILNLLKTEVESFRLYMERLSAKLNDHTLSQVLQSLSYQFAMESKRVYRQELRDILQKKSPQQIRGKIENSHGILKNLVEQSVIQVAQIWRPQIKGEEIFPSFTTKLEQSLSLRQDIYVLERLISLYEDSLASGKDGSISEGLKNYMSYFESYTFRLLRHDDYEEFLSFFEWFLGGKTDDTQIIIDRCKHFRIYLQTTLGHINNRAELLGKPLDRVKAEQTIRQYIK